MDDRATTDLLRELDARRRIHDVMLRYTRGLDRLDEQLIKDCYHPDAEHDHGMFRGTGHDFARYAVGSLASMERTMHCILNTLVAFDDDVSATAESYGMALHRVASTASATGWADHTAFVRYVDRLERRDEVGWRIADRVVVYEWTRVDAVVREWRLAGSERGARDGSDPVYRGGVIRTPTTAADDHGGRDG